MYDFSQKICLASAMALFSGYAANAQETLPNTALGFAANNVQGTYSVDRVGGEKVSIWKDTTNAYRFFYPPSLLPDWKKFGDEVSLVCLGANAGPPLTYQIRVPIYLDDNFYEDDILAALRNDMSLSDDVRSKLKVAAIPYDNIQIVLDVPRNSAHIVVETKNAQRDINFSRKTISYTYPSAEFMEISGTCEYFQQITDMTERDQAPLYGKLFAAGVEYDTTYLSGIVTQNLSRSVSNEIFGTESIVRNASVSSESEPEKSVLTSLLSLVTGSNTPSGINTANSAEAGRQRLLTRNFLNSVVRDAETNFQGVCTGTQEACAQAVTTFSPWLLSTMKPITLDLVPDEAGGAALVKDQITYATLSPQEYSTILKSAPNLEVTSEATSSQSGSSEESESNKNGGEESSEGDKDSDSESSTEKSSEIVKDDITWQTSGPEPIPTNVMMLIADELLISASASIDWYQNTPIDGTSSIYVIDLPYPTYAYSQGSIRSPEELASFAKLRTQCENGQLSVELSQQNLTYEGDRRISVSPTFRRFQDDDYSRRCSDTFDAKWSAIAGHFFYFSENPYDTQFFYRKDRFGFEPGYPLVERASGNVEIDGNPQAVSSIHFKGSARGDSGTTDDQCGIRIEFHAEQYPDSCKPFLIDGYVE